MTPTFSLPYLTVFRMRRAAMNTNAGIKLDEHTIAEAAPFRFSYLETDCGSHTLLHKSMIMMPAEQ